MKKKRTNNSIIGRRFIASVERSLRPLLKNRGSIKSMNHKTIEKTVQSVEKFAGIPMDKLREVGASCYHFNGLKKVSEDQLQFGWKSRKNKMSFEAIISLDKNTGKMRYMGNYYPGQYRNSADTFVDRVNDLYFK